MNISRNRQTLADVFGLEAELNAESVDLSRGPGAAGDGGRRSETTGHLNEEAETELAELDDENELYACFLYRASHLACAYYDQNKKCIFYLNDVRENERFELASLLIDDLGPSAIVTSARCDRNFVKFLSIKCKYIRENLRDAQRLNDDDDDDEAEDEDEETGLDEEERRSRRRMAREALELDDDQEDVDLDAAESAAAAPASASRFPFHKRARSISLFLLPGNEFNYELSKERIAQLDSIDGLPANMNGSERLLYFNSLLNFESQLMVSAIGGLLRFLDRHKINAAGADGDSSTSRTPVHALRQIRCDRILLLDANTFRALQIFNEVDYKYAFRQAYKTSDRPQRSAWNQSASSSAGTGDSVSLYGHFLAHVQTKAGAAKLRSWMLKPTRDPGVLDERQRMVEFIIKNRHNELIAALAMVIRKCKFVAPIFRRMRISKCSLADWKRVVNTSEALVQVCQLTGIVKSRCGLPSEPADELDNADMTIDQTEINETLLEDVGFGLARQQAPKPSVEASRASQASSLLSPIVGESVARQAKAEGAGSSLFERINAAKYGAKFEYLLDLYARTVDKEASSSARKVRVNSSVSPELHEKMQTWSRLTELLTKAGKEQMAALKITECQTIYLPHYGFLISISTHQIRQRFSDSAAELNDLRARFEREHELIYIFRSTDEFYYKNACMQQFDREYGNLSWEINDIESRLVESLQTEFVKHSHYFSNAIDYCAELDCLFAFAMVAVECDYTKPALCLDGSSSFLWARDARHPLFETVLPEFSYVPNDVQLGGDAAGRIKIVTSPNASGKTVYLRQAGLLVYMAMIGSFVPAVEARIGDFDRIFTRINSNESISLRMSTFSIDLQQMSDAIAGSTCKSLVLVDEFGKGTQAADGQALLAAVVRHWLRAPQERLPHVLIATHFYEMFQEAMATRLFVQNRERLEHLTFECFQVDEEEEETTVGASARRLVFLYKLRPGLTESSFALSIAHSVGLPDQIIKRAVELLELMKAPVGASVQTPESVERLAECRDVIHGFLLLSSRLAELRASESQSEEEITAIKAREYRSFLRERFAKFIP